VLIPTEQILIAGNKLSLWSEAILPLHLAAIATELNFRQFIPKIYTFGRLLMQIDFRKILTSSLCGTCPAISVTKSVDNKQ
jgi:hypothetical protein